MNRASGLAVFLGLLLALTGCAILVGKIEIPKYKVIQSSGPIEVREYPAQIVAEVKVTGKRGDAANDGFRILADYIFGNNLPRKSIAMTAPVTQERGKKIAMTAPVTQTGAEDVWSVRFNMPASYTLENLPKPNNPEVVIREVEPSRAAVIRFSGFWSQKNLAKHRQELETFLEKNQIKTVGEPVYAFYNPPWTLPMFRRIEVIYRLEPAGEVPCDLVLSDGELNEKAVFGAGCFWGVESAFRQVPGVLNVTAGYMGGTLKNPTYEQVCTDKTGHAEVVQVEYDPKKVSYEKLLETFWSIHDPTTPNRQGPDVGTQYRSVIFYFTPEQKKLALASKTKFQNSGEVVGSIVTEIAPAQDFYPAEDYHQRYYEKKGIKPLCHLPRKK